MIHDANGIAPTKIENKATRHTPGILIPGPTGQSCLAGVPFSARHVVVSVRSGLGAEDRAAAQPPGP